MIKEVIIVEGKYDKIKLESLTDATVIQTNGFALFKDKALASLIKKYAKERGIVVLTDSDNAGMVIRNRLKSIIPNEQIKNAYVPQISGKEKRKSAPSKQGILGVEGLNREIILSALEKAGCSQRMVLKPITKTDLFEDGLTGGTNSAVLRKALLKKLDLPDNLSVNAMLDALNTFVGYEKYKELVK